MELAIGATFGGVDKALGGDFLGSGFVLGSFIGGVSSPSVEDFLKGAPLWHTAMRGASSLGLSGGVAYAAHELFDLSFDQALAVGSIASGAINALVKKMIPCFPAGTPIRTPLGFKPIEEIQADDLVLSRPEGDPHADVGYQRVLEAHQRVGEILTIHIGGREIQTTTEHPFFVRRWENPNRPSGVYALQSDGELATATVDPVISYFDWTEAQDLRPGDEVSTSDGRWLKIDRIERDGTETVVYNMTVEEWHTYFIGEPDWGFDVWVHNTHTKGSVLANQLGMPDAPDGHVWVNRGGNLHIRKVDPLALKQRYNATNGSFEVAPHNLTQSEVAAIRRIRNIERDHLKNSDFTGTIHDMSGSPIPKPGGGYYDHIDEMNSSLRGLRKHVNTLQYSTDSVAIAARNRAVGLIQKIEEVTAGLGI